MLLTLQQATDWQDILLINAFATSHSPLEENLADDDDESFDDMMQDEDDLYEARNEDNLIAPGDEDHLPDDDLQ